MIAAFPVACSKDEPASSDPLDAALPIALENASDFSREILEDGVVTFAELESSFFAFQECVRAGGFPNAVGSVLESGEATMSNVWGRDEPTAEEQDNWMQTERGCAEEDFLVVSAFYRPPASAKYEDPYPPDVSAEIAVCMAERGLELSRVPVGFDDWQFTLMPLGEEAGRLFRECEGLVVGVSE